jgi:hypothetical protein
MAEVKRAYRLLAKAFHPDSAGDVAIPRFLAIHEAYEEITTGRVPARSKTQSGASAPAAAAGEPWRADPARARAARERARTPRGRGGAAGSGPTGPSTAGAGSASGAAGSSARGGRTATGSSGASSSSTGAKPRSGRRSTRKATMGSTSYDEARDVNDPTWSGASWYGPSSGEYWIVNPREYADPRKHGPDYQSRARRPLDGPPEAGAPRATAASSTTAEMGPGPARDSGHPTATGWTPPINERRWERDAAWRRPGEAARDGAGVGTFESISRGWLAGSVDDPIRRLGLALVAWPPIGLAVASAIGDLTGCATFSAGCTGSEPLLPWLAQALILGLLLLLSPLTRLLAGGAIGVLVAIVPVTAFLVAAGAGRAPQSGPVLAALLGIGWLAGIAWTARELRRGSGSRAGT